MAPDAYVTISPHFRVPEGRLEDFKMLCQRFVDTVANDDGCVRYSWGFVGNEARCREDFVNADAALAHFGSVVGLTEEAYQLAELVSLEVLAPDDELAKLRPILTEAKHNLFAVEVGFRR